MKAPDKPYPWLDGFNVMPSFFIDDVPILSEGYRIPKLPDSDLLPEEIAANEANKDIREWLKSLK